MFDDKTRKQIAEIAREIDVPAAALLAVAEVESGGRAYAKVQGKYEPLIRFEGHYFDRFLRGDARIFARKAGLASPVPGRVRNPRSQTARWKKLERAIEINRVAALSSCSWGLGQVMGAHWKWLGFGSVDALVKEARSGISGQVRLMARYIEKADLNSALRAQNWRKFARIYNGPAFAKNRYDEKMAQAFSRYQKKEQGRELPQPAGEKDSKLMFGARGSAVKHLQNQLSRFGYFVKKDGVFGLITDRTVRAFQRDHGLPQTGVIGKREQLLLASTTGLFAFNVHHSAQKLRRFGGPRVRVLGKRGGEWAVGKARIIRERLLSLLRRFA